MVSIITINYNGWKDTCELIMSLKQFESYPYEVIVVDNASKEDEANFILTANPEVTVIRSFRNLGFAGGNNLGYTYAKGKYIFFLNNDTVIKAPILEALVNKLNDPIVGGVSPMLRCYYSPYDVQYYGYQKMSQITLRHATPPYDATCPQKYLVDREVEVMHGAAMMLRRDVIERVGLMSEVYFLYFEEFDWSYCILECGYKIWYEPKALVFHKEGTRIGGITPMRKYYLVRGRFLFARRNLCGLNKILSCLYLLTVVIIQSLVECFIRGNWKMVKAMFTGMLSGFFSSKNGTNKDKKYDS